MSISKKTKREKKNVKDSKSNGATAKLGIIKYSRNSPGRGYRVKVNAVRSVRSELKMFVCHVSRELEMDHISDPWNFRAGPCWCTSRTNVNGSLLAVTTSRDVRPESSETVSARTANCDYHTWFMGPANPCFASVGWAKSREYIVNQKWKIDD